MAKIEKYEMVDNSNNQQIRSEMVDITKDVLHQLEVVRKGLDNNGTAAEAVDRQIEIQRLALKENSDVQPSKLIFKNQRG